MSKFKLSAEVDTSLPTPPFVPVPGVPNFRDLGGYLIPALPGRKVKTGLIYRCGEPSAITPDGILKLNELGVKNVYDLRSKPEIEKAKAVGYGQETEWEGCERCFVPVFEETDYSPESVALRFKNYASDGVEGFTIAYLEILANAPPSYSRILRHLLDLPGVPLIIHCTAGKDRTGVICALILSLCGVEDETIAEEYSLTEIGLPKQWKEVVIEHLMENPELRKNPRGAWNLISAKKENMASFLEALREQFGGAEQYLIDKCGFSREEIEKIRQNLVVDA